MELALVPDIYSPSIDGSGNYIDKMPSFKNIQQGLSCPCGSRKDKLFSTTSTFSCHIKTKCHQSWIESINLNKGNYLVENEKMKELIYNQKMVIAKLEKDINTKIMTIDYLTNLLTKINHNSSNSNSNYIGGSEVINLIEFD